MAAVSASGVSLAHPQGTGWTLALSKGWRLAPGARAGDFVVMQDASKP